MVGLNFRPSFLSEDWQHSSLEAMVRHACHLKLVGGAQVIAVGTDFGKHLPSTVSQRRTLKGYGQRMRSGFFPENLE
ncbi:hypothetical protein DYP60_02345 [Sphaerochaeta halotolerans]|uniref:Uncharacterized protein n=1 Tax=Sphaerochaeta halotolerans TaxID=2293840 RepID=A0A372MJA6_9SPIR|nr:hypothetical protein DYP60_02345 [Sphaerochaeta halotolerans]